MAKKPRKPSPRRSPKPYRSSKKRPTNLPLVLKRWSGGPPENERMLELQALYDSLMSELLEYSAIHGNVQDINPEDPDAPAIVKVHAVAAEFLFTWDLGQVPQQTGIYTQQEATDAANVFIEAHGTTLSQEEFGSLALLMRGKAFYALAPYYSGFIPENLPQNLMIW